MKYTRKGSILIDGIVFASMMLSVLFAYTSATRFVTTINRASLIIFIALIILFFNHIDLVEALKNKDRELLASILIGIFTIINMFFSESGPGVIFDIANFVLILYLSDKIELDDKIIFMVTCMFLVCFFYWVKADGSAYNPNTISMIVFEMAVLSSLGIAVILSKYDKEQLTYAYLIIALVFIAWPTARKFRGRTTLVAIVLVMFFFLVVPKVIWQFRKLYACLLGGMAVVSLAVPAVFTGFYHKYGILLANKLLGGREPVWLQFFEAWKREPLTGIGNDYTAKISELHYANVHNGMLHILFIYGIIIFVIVMYLFGRKMMKIHTEEITLTKKLGISLIIAMLAISIMETYIVTPFANIFLFWVFLIVFRDQRNEQLNN